MLVPFQQEQSHILSSNEALHFNIENNIIGIYKNGGLLQKENKWTGEQPQKVEDLGLITTVNTQGVHSQCI